MPLNHLVEYPPRGEPRCPLISRLQIYAKKSLKVNMSAEWKFLDPLILRSSYIAVLTASVLGRISGIAYLRGAGSKPLSENRLKLNDTPTV